MLGTQRTLLVALLFSSLGCGTFASSEPRPGWLGGIAELLPARPPADCRYLTVLIQHSNNGTGMSERDALLAQEVADLMAKEFASRGTRVIRSGEEAYFSLLVLAAEEPVHDGFVFSAVLAARGRKEAHEAGVDTYAKPGETPGTATLFHGMSWGEQSRLRKSVRDYVKQADVALLPLAHDLCEFDRLDRERQDALDAQLAEHGAPL